MEADGTDPVEDLFDNRGVNARFRHDPTGGRKRLFSVDVTRKLSIIHVVEKRDQHDHVRVSAFLASKSSCGRAHAPDMLPVVTAAFMLMKSLNGRDNVLEILDHRFTHQIYRRLDISGMHKEFNLFPKEFLVSACYSVRQTPRSVASPWKLSNGG